MLLCSCFQGFATSVIKAYITLKSPVSLKQILRCGVRTPSFLVSGQATRLLKFHSSTSIELLREEAIPTETVAEIAAIASTHQCHVVTSSSALQSSPHVIPPRMLSVIRDQGPCDLWGMSSTRDWRLLTSGSKGIS